MTPFDTNLALAETGEAAVSDAETFQLTNRFGTFDIDPNKVIEMPQGPMGFAEMTRYALLDVPGAEEGAFKLFQSLDDTALTFIVVHLPQGSSAIAEADIVAGCHAYAMRRENVAVLLIANVRSEADGKTTTTVNLKAPLLVDTRHRVARQVVFTNDAYDLRHPLA